MNEHTEVGEVVARAADAAPRDGGEITGDGGEIDWRLWEMAGRSAEDGRWGVDWDAVGGTS